MSRVRQRWCRARTPDNWTVLQTPPVRQFECSRSEGHAGPHRVQASEIGSRGFRLWNDGDKETWPDRVEKGFMIETDGGTERK